jgi:hypothetical protein
MRVWSRGHTGAHRFRPAGGASAAEKGRRSSRGAGVHPWGCSDRPEASPVGLAAWAAEGVVGGHGSGELRRRFGLGKRCTRFAGGRRSRWRCLEVSRWLRSRGTTAAASSARRPWCPRAPATRRARKGEHEATREAEGASE